MYFLCVFPGKLISLSREHGHELRFLRTCWSPDSADRNMSNEQGREECQLSQKTSRISHSRGQIGGPGNNIQILQGRHCKHNKKTSVQCLRCAEQRLQSRDIFHTADPACHFIGESVHQLLIIKRRKSSAKFSVKYIYISHWSTMERNSWGVGIGWGVVKVCVL